MAKKAKTKKQAPAEWQGAVDASAAHEEETTLPGTGVLHEDGGDPTYLENLSPKELAVVADDLTDKLVEIAAAEQDAKDTAAKFRKSLKDMRKERDRLRDEHKSGQRKVPAQKKLPGTEARA